MAIIFPWMRTRKYEDNIKIKQMQIMRGKLSDCSQERLCQKQYCY
jgi:hypothetical protein